MCPGSRSILESVNAVQTAKNHYKTLMPMLINRNMTSLHRVCLDIASNNSPPHKEVHGLERCYITGVWHEKCIDVTKGNRSTTTPTSTPAMSPSTPTSGVPTSSVPTSGGYPTSGYPPHSPTVSCCWSPAGTVGVTGGSMGGVFISPRFRHFAQMLWTIAKVDMVIKNYTLAWFQSNNVGVMGSRQDITYRFDNEYGPFCESLYKIFIHAIHHVCNSLYCHMYNPILSSTVQPPSLQSPPGTFRATTIVMDHGGDTEMGDHESTMRATLL